MKTKLKNTDENCECHCHIKRHSCKLDELHLLECSHCNPEKLPCGCPKQDEYSICINQEHLSNPEKQGDWEKEFDERFLPEQDRVPYYVEYESAKDFIRQLEKQTRESVIDSFIVAVENMEVSRVGGAFNDDQHVQLEYDNHILEIMKKRLLSELQKLKQKTKE